ncbi:MAG: 2-amino-4-hydroxy-6-hydroxymethyldihydropteridine diphosphokinase [Pseudolysinimonas sp.]
MQAPHPAVVAFGSNLGDRAAILHSAAAELADADGVELTAMSGLHESIALKPGGADRSAPAYLNAVALVDTTLSPDDLLALLHRIEAGHGRERVEVWADRTLDLDLIDFAGLTRGSGGDGRGELTLPHPRARERDFVLRPWLEVDPDAVLSGSGRVADLVVALDAAGHAEVTP